MMTAPRAAPRAQRQAVAVAQPRNFFNAPAAAPQQASFITKPDFSLNPAASLFTLKKRQMSTMTGINMRVLVPTDPRFADDDVISVLNTKTGLIEPVIVAAPDFSFEWIYGSPCDLHTFDVIPVVKDCIDPADPLVESMGA
eukprot:UN02963